MTQDKWQPIYIKRRLSRNWAPVSLNEFCFGSAFRVRSGVVSIGANRAKAKAKLMMIPFQNGCAPQLNSVQLTLTDT